MRISYSLVETVIRESESLLRSVLSVQDQPVSKGLLQTKKFKALTAEAIGLHSIGL